MIRKALLTSVALLLVSSAAFAQSKNVTTIDINGAKLSIITNATHGTRQATKLRYPGADFSNFDTKYPNGTYVPWEGYIFCGSPTANNCTSGQVNFAYPFTTGSGSGQKAKGFDLALELVSGTGGVTTCLEADSGGTPSGTCMTGTTTYFANGSLAPWGNLVAPLSASFHSQNLTSSTQYWAVAIADANTAIAADVEDTDFVNAGNFGEQISGVWYDFSSIGFVPAFDIIK
jgi:hypothetical protein